MKIIVRSKDMYRYDDEYCIGTVDWKQLISEMLIQENREEVKKFFDHFYTFIESEDNENNRN